MCIQCEKRQHYLSYIGVALFGLFFLLTIGFTATYFTFKVVALVQKTNLEKTATIENKIDNISVAILGNKLAEKENLEAETKAKAETNIILNTTISPVFENSNSQDKSLLKVAK